MTGALCADAISAALIVSLAYYLVVGDNHNGISQYTGGLLIPNFRRYI